MSKLCPWEHKWIKIRWGANKWTKNLPERPQTRPQVWRRIVGRTWRTSPWRPWSFRLCWERLPTFLSVFHQLAPPIWFFWKLWLTSLRRWAARRPICARSRFSSISANFDAGCRISSKRDWCPNRFRSNSKNKYALHRIHLFLEAVLPVTAAHSMLLLVLAAVLTNQSMHGCQFEQFERGRGGH